MQSSELTSTYHATAARLTGRSRRGTQRGRRELLKLGAELENLGHVDDFKPIYIVAGRGHQDIVLELASNEVNVNTRNDARNDGGTTPLEIAEFQSRHWTTES